MEMTEEMFATELTRKWNKPVAKRFGTVIVRANIDEIWFAGDEWNIDLRHYLVLTFFDAKTGKTLAWTDYRGSISIELYGEAGQDQHLTREERIRKGTIYLSDTDFQWDNEIAYWVENQNNIDAEVTENDISKAIAETGRDYGEIFDEMLHLFWEGIPDDEVREALLRLNDL